MRVIDLKEIIASLPDDQTVHVAVEGRNGLRIIGKEFMEITIDAMGTRQIIFGTKEGE